MKPVTIIITAFTAPLGMAACALVLAIGHHCSPAPASPAIFRTTDQALHTASGQLVRVCTRQPCPGGQELEVDDRNGAPIFSVGEYGGAAVYGDNVSVYPPGSAYHPAIVLSWESPAAYDRQFRLPFRCTAPALWEEPAGTWTCYHGIWMRQASLQPGHP